jgi:hypothetical protein
MPGISRLAILVVGAALIVAATSPHAQTAQDPAQFGGPSSAGADLKRSAGRANISDSLHLGFEYSVMLQSATEGSGPTDAARGVARFFGSADLCPSSNGLRQMAF